MNDDELPTVGYAAMTSPDGYSGPRRTRAEIAEWANGRPYVVWPLKPLPPHQRAAYARLDQPPPMWDSWPPVEEQCPR